MTILVKLSGIFLIFITCTLAGFLKSASLKKRTEQLRLAAASVAELASRIRSDSGEIEGLIQRTFGSTIVSCERGKISVNKTVLGEGGTAILEELFCDMGMRDSLAEYERTLLYAELMQKQYKESSRACGELCRLYNSLGVLCGIFLCIFFM